MRTQNSIKNVVTTVLPFVIIGVLGFVKVKVFVAFLRDDLYSLNQLFYQIFSYLSLADAGFGLFVIQKYYKLLASNDKAEVKKTFANSLAFFRAIGLFIIVVSIGLSFFVHFLTKANVEQLYMQVIFMIFIVKNSVDYFMMAPRFLIAADQKMFKINVLINSFKILEIIFEIILVYLGVNYLIVLTPGIVVRVIANILVNRIVYAEYPYIKNVSPELNLNKLKGVEDILVQRIVGIFHSNTDIILISSFISPMAVVSYASYTYITKFIFDITYMVASAVNASFAHVINNTKQAVKKVFNDLETVFFLEASVVFIVIYTLLNSVIKLWVGDKYLFSELSLWLLLVILYLQIIMRPLYMTVDSEGYFKETKRMMIVEAMINLILSVVLVGKFGLAGVLIGTLVSILATSFWYLPNFIYKKMFKQSAFEFFMKVCVNLFFTVVGAVGLRLFLGPANSLSNLVIKLFMAGALSIVYVLLVNYKLLNIRSLANRFKYILEARRAK